MRRELVVVILTCAMGTLTPQSVRKSPKEVVEDFCKFETAGGRLTPEGWNKAAAYFVTPTPLPQEKTILVTEKTFFVWDPDFRNNTTAEVTVGVTGRIWKIDSQMRFSAYSSPSEIKSAFYYTLVLTNKPRKLASNGQVAEEATAAPEWRIVGSGNTIWLTVETAIRYATDVLNHTSDRVVKENAEKTLLRLNRLHR